MMKLKKFASVLALTIAVSQVFAVVPAHAEETTTEVTCEHEKCDEGVTDNAICNNCINSGEGAYTWVKVDDKTHNEVLVCEWCGSEKEVVETGISHSNGENGKCKCGYNMNATSGGNDIPKEEPKKEEKPIVPQKSKEEVISEALAQATEETIRAEEAMPVTSFVSTEG